MSVDLPAPLRRALPPSPPSRPSGRCREHVERAPEPVAAARSACSSPRRPPVAGCATRGVTMDRPDRPSAPPGRAGLRTRRHRQRSRAGIEHDHMVGYPHHERHVMSTSNTRDPVSATSRSSPPTTGRAASRPPAVERQTPGERRVRARSRPGAGRRGRSPAPAIRSPHSRRRPQPGDQRTARDRGRESALTTAWRLRRKATSTSLSALIGRTVAPPRRRHPRPRNRRGGGERARARQC